MHYPSLPYSISKSLSRIFLNAQLSHGIRDRSQKGLPCLTSPPHQQVRRINKGKTPATARFVRTERWNDEIEAHMIQLIDPATNRLLEPQTRRDVLMSFDPKVERLVEIQQSARLYSERRLAICKIVNIKAAADKEREREKALREQRRAEAAARSVKTLEINWNIDRHDLEHRMARAKEFLQEGRRVEIVLARKRRAKRAPLEQRDELVKQIIKTLEQVNGARLEKPMGGQLENVAQLSFKGDPAQAGTKEDSGLNEDVSHTSSAHVTPTHVPPAAA